MCAWKFFNLARGILICGVLTSFPLTAQSRKTQAQYLIDQTVEKHPEVTGLELSATPAGQEVALRSPRQTPKDLGEKSDDEATALKTQKPFVEQEPDGFDVTTPLHDASGKLIGTLGIDFKPHAGQTRTGILKRTIRILKEVERQIPSKAFLFEPASGV
jgi:hypothetical protein